jgi:CDP-glucose 4,6-dehydratase
LESFAVNVLGTVNLLQALRQVTQLAAVLVITSDKVYAERGDGNPHVEADRLGGKEPYAASKAAAELAAAAMAHSFLEPAGVAVATARAGNVIGGGDFATDRLVPDIVRAVRADLPLTLRHPTATRPWQHVLDCVAGYLAYLAALGTGQPVPPTLNFGPRLRSRATVEQLATAMLVALDAKQAWIRDQEQGSLETHTLSLDSRLARRTLGWTDRLIDKQMITATASWYQAWARGDDMHAVTLRQIKDYEAMP